MIAYQILIQIQTLIKPIIKDVSLHPAGRNKVGNKTPYVLIRKGNEELTDRMTLKGHIAKKLEMQILLITEYNDIKQILEKQVAIENAVMNMDLGKVSGLYCIEWDGAEVPPETDTLNAFSFDTANIVGNRQLTLIRYSFFANQVRS